MTIQEIKDRTCIEELVSNYTELTGTGNRLRAVKGQNPVRGDGSGDFDIYLDTQKFFDYGMGEGGDVIDFIQLVENLDRSAALSFLQERLGGMDTNYTPRPRVQRPVKQKDNPLLIRQLTEKANRYLSASPERTVCGRSRPVPKWQYFTLETDRRSDEVIRVAEVFEKLFEGHIMPTDKRFAQYLFTKVIGYCSYFDCPVIVIRDESETVVDIVRYRPYREGFDDLPKYLYTKKEEKPDSGYLFPLQAQMTRMMVNHGYCFVGEGLKNAINASLAGVPFVTIEGAASIKPALIEFLKSDRMNGITLVGAFDGDEAGERAYKKINAEIPMINEFSFDSGMDFAEWMKGVRQ